LTTKNPFLKEEVAFMKCLPSHLPEILLPELAP